MIRECCDSKKHPESLPIILALDATGSMDDTAIKFYAKRNTSSFLVEDTVVEDVAPKTDADGEIGW